jgi:hypothetical protein
LTKEYFIVIGKYIYALALQVINEGAITQINLWFTITTTNLSVVGSGPICAPAIFDNKHLAKCIHKVPKEDDKKN